MTRIAALLLVLGGLLAWSAALALVPASGAAGDAAERAGLSVEASPSIARFLRAELLDVRLVALTVVGVGLSLLMAGRPVPAGHRWNRPTGAFGVVLFGANAAWTQVPGAPVSLTFGSTALLLAGVGVLMARSGGEPGGDPGAVPALLAAGTVLALTFLASAESHVEPFVPEAHLQLVVATRELGVIAAVVAACAVGRRWVAFRAAAGTVAAVGAVVVFALAMREDAIPGPVAQLLVGLAGVVVLILLWSGDPAPARARVRRAVGVLVAAFVGWAAQYLLVIPGAVLVYGIQPLAAVGNDDVGFPTFGIGLMYGLVLIGVYRAVDRVRGPGP